MPKSSFQVFSDVNTKVIGGYVEPKSSATGKVVTERVENVMGSCAGAGSESIDTQRQKEEEERLFKEKLALNKKLDEERMQKNAKKRMRLKQRKEKNKKKSKTVDDTGEEKGKEKSSGESSDEAEEQGQEY